MGSKDFRPRVTDTENIGIKGSQCKKSGWAGG